MHQPSRANQEKLDILKERWFFSFNFMAVKLKNPCYYKEDYGKKPQGYR